MRKRNLFGLPTFFWMAVFVGGPLVYIAVLSFMTRGPSGEVVFRFTLENYARITDAVNIKVFRESILTAFTTCAAALAVGYPFAYFTSRLNKNTRFYVLVFVMIAFWTSSLIRSYGWIIVLQNNGILSHMFEILGLSDEPRRFMYNHTAVVFVTTYMLLPFMILPVYNAVERIDPSLYEAAYDLGAGRLRAFFSVTLPLSMPGVAGGLTLVFIPAVGLFFISDLLGGAQTMLLGGLIRDQMGSARNWPFGAALAVVMLLMTSAFTALYLAIAKDGGEGLF